jgi:hypothetical protein
MTIQAASVGQDKDVKVRNNATFSSRIFDQPDNIPDDTQRPPSRSRKEEKWCSTVFAGPID